MSREVDAATLDQVRRISDPIQANVERAIVGKHDEVRLCLVTLLCQGHLLIEDVPGVGKTMLAKALARSMDCSFRRIQFTPDLLPSDVTGVSAFNQKTSDFEFRPGPVFAQKAVRDVFVKTELKEYVARLVERTRNHPEIALGASTRGTLNLFHAAQALAALLGHGFVLPDDIKALVEPILGHRIILRPNAEMQGASPARILNQLMEREHVPQLSYER